MRVSEMMARALFPDATEFIYLPPMVKGTEINVFPFKDTIRQILRGELPPESLAQISGETVHLKEITFGPPLVRAGMCESNKKVFIYEE